MSVLDFKAVDEGNGLTLQLIPDLARADAVRLDERGHLPVCEEVHEIGVEGEGAIIEEVGHGRSGELVQVDVRTNRAGEL